jgi:hypothetical protein
VQVLPSRNATEVLYFDPVFKPFAPDPPRNLPSVIRAGVVVPPIPSDSPRQNVSAKIDRGTGSGTLDSLNHDSDNGKHGNTRTTLEIAIGAILFGMGFCVACTLLYALGSPKRPWQGLTQRLRKILPQKTMLRKAASFKLGLEDGKVRISIQDSFRV